MKRKVTRTPPASVRIVRRTVSVGNASKGYANGARIFAVGDVGRQFANANGARNFGFGGTGRQFA